MRRKFQALAGIAVLALVFAAPATAQPTSSYSISATYTGSGGGAVVANFSETAVTSVVVTQNCPGGGVETWSSTTMTASSVAFDSRLTSVNVTSQFIADHVPCGGGLEVGVPFSADFVNGGAFARTVRTRDASTGDRILTTGIFVTVVVPNDGTQGITGDFVEVISR